MMKITININTIIPMLMQPTLMHYEHCFLCVAHACPHDRQSSCAISTVTATSYIQVTKESDLHVETTSPMKEIPVTLPFHNSFIILLGYYVIYPGYPKYYIGYV